MADYVNDRMMALEWGTWSNCTYLNINGTPIEMNIA
jgi:hypothetical protein